MWKIRARGAGRWHRWRLRSRRGPWRSRFLRIVRGGGYFRYSHSGGDVLRAACGWYRSAADPVRRWQHGAKRATQQAGQSGRTAAEGRARPSRQRSSLRNGAGRDGRRLERHFQVTRPDPTRRRPWCSFPDRFVRLAALLPAVRPGRLIAPAIASSTSIPVSIRNWQKRRRFPAISHRSSMSCAEVVGNHIHEPASAFRPWVQPDASADERSAGQLQMSVRVELQADCFAGVWGWPHAEQKGIPGSRRP